MIRLCNKVSDAGHVLGRIRLQLDFAFDEKGIACPADGGHGISGLGPIDGLPWRP